MANQIYEQLNKQNPQSEYGNFMQNPFQYLLNKRINIPTEYQNDPHSAVQYLISSGQMNQNAFNRLFSKLQSMGYKF